MLKKHYSEATPLCRVTFTLPIEAANGGREVRLLGDFNAWRWEDGVRLQPRDTAFEADVELPAGKRYEFRYLIDNAIWENDWEADGYVPTPFGVNNSVVWLSDVVGHEVRPVQERPDVVAQAPPPIAAENGAGGTTRAADDTADGGDDLVADKRGRLCTRHGDTPAAQGDLQANPVPGDDLPAELRVVHPPKKDPRAR